MSPPLSGILVLDFSQYIAGPYCGLLLADLGAEVIKIESLHGAEERGLGNTERYKGNTRMSLTMNRGKKSISVDLQTKEGREIVYKMVKKADITVQNFAPYVAEKLGVDYETLSKLNKRLIFISSTAFGERGPYHQRKGFDIIAHAASGVMSYYADEKGLPRGPGGPAYIDVCTALLNTISAITALYARNTTGEGQKIESSLFNSGIAIQAPMQAYIESLDKENNQEELNILDAAHKQGKTHTQIIDEFVKLRLRYDQPDTVRPIEVPDCSHRPADRQVYPYYRIYETANGYIGIAALTIKHRMNLGRVLGITDEGVDANIGNISDDHYYHLKEVMAQIEDRLKEKTNEEWIQVLEEKGIPCGQINYLANIYDDPQANAVDMIWELENSILGKYKMAGHPVRYEKTPVEPTHGAPTLGEHTDDVLSRFGYTDDEIRTLKESRVIR